jgi:hypothetical protein
MYSINSSSSFYSFILQLYKRWVRPALIYLLFINKGSYSLKPHFTFISSKRPSLYNTSLGSYSNKIYFNKTSLHRYSLTSSYNLCFKNADLDKEKILLAIKGKSGVYL